MELSFAVSPESRRADARSAIRAAHDLARPGPTGWASVSVFPPLSPMVKKNGRKAAQAGIP